MNILRTVNGIDLNEGNLMANGLFNISTDDNVSFWFDVDTKDELMSYTDKEFQEKSESLIAESLVD